MLKSYKYRLYPNKEQKKMFEKHFGCVRYVYNYGLERKIKTYQESKKYLSCFDLIKEITKIKKEDTYKFLSKVTAQSLQMSLRNLDNGFTAFFRKNNRFPKFKNKHSNNSFQYPQQVWIKNKKIKLPKIGKVKIKLSRKFEGKIKTTTVSKTPTGKYFVSILVDNKKALPEKCKIEKTIGIDVGIKTFATISTGEKIDNPKFLKKSLGRLKVLQQRLSNKTKGSKNRLKTKHRVALIHEKITNQRSDFLHKLSTRLVSENQAIALEDLNVKGMIKNHNLAQSIGDCSWSKFMRMIEYKSEWQGKHVHKIGRFQPSSKICSCGEINNELKLSDREWTCKECSTTHDRDILAAQNILNFSGLVQPIEPVEMSTLVESMKQETYHNYFSDDR